jgi:hypothetical protein
MRGGRPGCDVSVLNCVPAQLMAKHAHDSTHSAQHTICLCFAWVLRLGKCACPHSVRSPQCCQAPLTRRLRWAIQPVHWRHSVSPESAAQAQPQQTTFRPTNPLSSVSVAVRHLCILNQLTTSPLDPECCARMCGQRVDAILLVVYIVYAVMLHVWQAAVPEMDGSGGFQTQLAAPEHRATIPSGQITHFESIQIADPAAMAQPICSAVFRNRVSVRQWGPPH